jgi:TonB-dependent starch-binding outer membrane protein SusC
MRFTIGRTGHGAALALATALCVASPLAAQQGSVAGRVTDKATAQPLSGAQVSVVGTTLRTLTGSDGRYQIANVTPGATSVRVSAIGYTPITQPVTVSAGATAELNFGLAISAFGLNQIVVTATGTEAARQQASAIKTIDAGKIAQQAPVTNLSDELNARAPGVVVQSSGGTTGSGTRIRIRGSNSVSLSNEPVLVLDGVRVENGPSSASVGVGGQVPSRLNDINPQDLETVQVASGPAATGLYGTDAANGVIQLRTKQGRAGPTHWEFYSEGGQLNDITTYPTNYQGVTAAGATCILVNVAAGSCAQASVKTFNPLETFSPFRTGNRSEFGLSASGGNERTTFYTSGHFEKENGVYEVNHLRRVSLRANLFDQARPNLDVKISTGYTSSSLRLPENDNNVFGVLSSGFLGFADSAINKGYGFLTPAQSFSIQTFQGIDRFTGSLNVNYRPASFLEFRAVAGNDFTSRYDQRTFLPGLIPQSFNNQGFLGQRTANPFQIYSWTANFTGTATFALTPSINSTTNAGLQYFHSLFHGVTAQRLTCAAGTYSLEGCVTPLDDETTQEFVTLGRFVEEQIGLKNRLYVTGALRSDDNSAFGSKFGNIVYPKAGASWVLSEEPFFPNIAWLSSLRIRASAGRSGLHPGPTDALSFFNQAPVLVAGVDVPSFTFGQVGEATLKPEKVNESEIGFDADLFSERAHIVFTYYNKTSHDALISVTLPPACGCGTSRFENLGSVNNKGVEIHGSADLVRAPKVSVHVDATAWGNRNRVLTLGKGIAPIIFGLGGATQRIAPGFAAGAYFQRPYTYADANGDGIIALGEVTLGPSSVFQGQPFPDHGGTFSTEVTLFGRLTLYGLLDGRFGNKLFNSTEQFRCGLVNCRGINDPKAPLSEQAAAVANILGSQAGYMEDGSFVKLREVSLTYAAPASWAASIHAQTLSITLSARNLKTWTSYKGVDPELNEAGQNNFTTADFLTQPPVRYFIARLNISF